MPKKANYNEDVFHHIEKCFLCKRHGDFLFSHKIRQKTKTNILSEYLEGKEFSYFICRECGIIYITPVFKENILINYYNSLCVNKDIEKSLYLPVMEEIIKYKKEGNLLDVGCGSGEILHLAKDFGFSSYGVEINSDAVNFLKNKGFNVFCGDFLNLNLQKNYFDVTTLMSVIEHLENPYLALEKCHHILKKDGIIVFLVPNCGISFKILKGRWIYASPLLGHIYCFSERAIKKLLTEAGFKNIIIKVSRPDSQLTPNEEHNFYFSLLSRMINSLNNFYPLIKSLRLGDALFVVGKKEK